MTNGKMTFILMKTSKPKVGRIYAMVHRGKTVISRNSLKMEIEYKYWDYNRNRVKNSHPDARIFNKTIEDKSREFEVLKRVVPSEDENQCALDYMRGRIENSGLALTSRGKYYTILKNFETVVYNSLKLESLPFYKLRDINLVRAIKSEIQKSSKKSQSKKTKSSWFNYMSVFAHYINDWNSNSGTQYPINVRPFTTDIGKDSKKFATSLAHEELQMIIDYAPTGKKNAFPQTLSKNIFLFQYHTGGIRIEDALVLTNKCIFNDGLQIKIKKSKDTKKFPFCFEQVETLREYYPFEYNSVISTVKTGILELSPSTIIQLNRVEGLGELSELGLSDLSTIRDSIERKSKSNPSLIEIKESFEFLEDELKKEIARQFFKLLRKRSENFLFPKLKWEEFSDAYKQSGEWDISQEHLKILHRAKSAHNSNLKRISASLDIPKVTGHTPRHTLANHLHSEGYSPEEIQKVLVHSSVNTTKHYLKNRHQNDEVNKTINESNNIFRKKRAKFKKGRN